MLHVSFISVKLREEEYPVITPAMWGSHWEYSHFMNGKTEAQRCFSHFFKAMQLVSGWAGIPQKRAGHHHPSILKAPWHLLLLFGYAGQGGCRWGCSPAERGWRDSSSWTSRAPRAGLPLTLFSLCSPHLMVWGGNALIKSKDFEGSPWWFNG